MFDIDSRVILTEIEPDVYTLNVILNALPAMACVIREDKVLESLHEAMKARVGELIPDDEEGREIEKMLVCGFSKQV